ncbi:hypothetical protein DAI21_19495 [Lelliottia sp. WB101]|uniref:SDR family oxidoreductase n=1 Tax=Lelliottia sp. WB101 TaxID=2153385 RepID=UPI000D2093B5|nr:SDR family oxidoreductase [Lelliottia sp. WB101]AVY99686.1 hypothetical protein DAI21_19495 [Lelliottia sp. WB101]
MLMKTKTVVIFGASGAIGSETARVMAREGAHIFLVARNRDKLERVANDIRSAGGIAESRVIDVLDERSVLEQTAKLAEQTGGIEAFVNALASELGPKNIRVTGVRSHAISGAVQAGSYTGELFAIKAQSMGVTVEQFMEGAAQSTMLKRLPTLPQVAGVIAFLASEHARAMTATMVNVTAGATLG